MAEESAIDFKGWDKYLEARTTKKIFISKELKRLTDEELYNLKNLYYAYGANEVSKCINLGETGTPIILEIVCPQCTGVENVKKSKTKLIEHLRDLKYVCQDCVDREKEKKEQERIESSKNNKKNKESATNRYIESYLDHKKSWKESCKQKDRFNEVARNNYYIYWVDWEAVKNCIQLMNYQDFLKTPYWKAIAAQTKYKAGFCCQLCNGKEGLATHHRTYENHGAEHAHLEDLIVLCENCHSKFHDKLKEKQE